MSCGRLRKGNYEIVIKRHAFERAMQRGVDPDLLEHILQTGTMRKFGKNRVKIEKKFRKFTVTCVDEIMGNILRIVTITKRVKR